MIITYIFSGITAVVHVYIFALETFLWGLPKTNRLYNVSPEQAETVRVFIFNQGYYNLFLAIAILLGIFLACVRSELVGHTLVVYGCASILGAGIVLVCSAPNLLKAALIQGVPPLIALIAFALAKLTAKT